MHIKNSVCLRVERSEGKRLYRCLGRHCRQKTASANVLRQEHAWHVGKIRGPLWMEQCK